ALSWPKNAQIGCKRSLSPINYHAARCIGLTQTNLAERTEEGITMGVVISGSYRGKKRVELTHEQSGSTIVTDAPLDNNGEGQSFSPTDLCASSLGSCILTVMA